MKRRDGGQSMTMIMISSMIWQIKGRYLAKVSGTFFLQRKFGLEWRGMEYRCILRMRREVAIMVRTEKGPMSTDQQKPMAVVACEGLRSGFAPSSILSDLRRKSWMVSNRSVRLMVGSGKR